MDDYKQFSFYEKRGGVPKNGFTSFSEKGEYFFTYNKDGKVVFISESYTTGTARNKGIASVKKNMKDVSRYKVFRRASGKYYLTLKAGNNKEICISKNFDSEEAAYAGASKVSGKTITKPLASLKRGVAKSTTKTATSKPNTVKTKGTTSKTSSNSKTSASSKASISSKTTVSKKVSSKPKTISVKKTSDKKTNTVASKTSKSKPVAAKSKATIKPVSTKKPASTNDSSSKTGLKPKATSSTGSKTGSTSGNVKKAAIVGAAGLAASAAAAKAGNKVFDYLSVASYKGEGKDGFTTFQDNASKAHYFGYNRSGKTLLRSSGSSTAKERDEKLASVKSNSNNSKNWKKGKTVDGKYYYFLTDQNNQEVGKSAIYDNISDMTGDLSWISGNINKGAVATVAATTKPISNITKPAATATVKTNQIINKKQDATYSASSDMNNEERERLRLQQLREQAMQDEGDGNKKWLPLLLLLLIPLLLGILLFKGCDGCNGGTKPVAKKPKINKNVIVDKTTKAKQDATELVNKMKNDLGKYTSSLVFDRGTIESTLKNCCDDRNCYDGKLYYWGEPNFSTNSATLSAASINSIENVAKLMKAYRGMSISILGNSSTNENETAVNGGLSTARAKAMRDLLISNGVDASKVSYSGNGNGNTINYNGDSKADYQNRRLDIVINSCKAAGGVK